MSTARGGERGDALGRFLREELANNSEADPEAAEIARREIEQDDEAEALYRAARERRG